jgi:hypothetical protein
MKTNKEYSKMKKKSDIQIRGDVGETEDKLGYPSYKRSCGRDLP